ncbi:MAG: winged helix-turn-helix domain-containing protein [Labedaea sp.]
MSKRDEMLSLLAKHPEGLTDAELARMTGSSHQTVNQMCRKLAAEHLIRRDDLGRPIMNFDAGDPPPAAPVYPPATHHDDWFWEGNVQSMVVRHLASRDAALRSVADTASKARGTDVVATLDGQMLHIEVKGWPSSSYADPRRAGEVKELNRPCRPSTGTPKPC